MENNMDILEKIVDMIKKGNLIWRDSLPYNPFSEVHYSGMNRMKLCLIKQEKGYKSEKWCTLNQAQNNGLNIKPKEQQHVLENWKFKDNNYDFENADVTTFSVFNLDQFNEKEIKDNLINKDGLVNKDELVDAGNFFDIQNKADVKQYKEPKEYLKDCVHLFIKETYKDENSLQSELIESFILAEFGVTRINETVPKEKINKWVNQGLDSKSFFKMMIYSEKEVRKVIGEFEEQQAMKYINKINEDVKKDFSDMSSIYRNLSKEVQYLYSLNNKIVSSEEIYNSLQDAKKRKEMVTNLINMYATKKNRSCITDLIIIGNIISSMAVSEKFPEKIKSIYRLEKEIYVIKENMTADKGTFDFGKNYEKHPYKLALHISENTSAIMNMPKEDIFELLKTKEGRDNILEIISKKYISMNEKSAKCELAELKLLKKITKEISELEHPEWKQNEEKYKEKTKRNEPMYRKRKSR